jgi:hypothetical protein
MQGSQVIFGKIVQSCGDKFVEEFILPSTDRWEDQTNQCTSEGLLVALCTGRSDELVELVGCCPSSATTYRRVQ